MSRQRYAGGAVGFAAALLYLSFPSARYNFDGVACAIAVDLADFRHLVHGNHLVYGLVGYLWHSFWRMLGYGGPSLQSLQALNSLLGALGAGLFVRLAVRSGGGLAAAMVGGAGLMVSRIYWTWSLEAQVYPLGAVFLIAAATEALGERPRAPYLALAHAGAMLGHVGHAMFIPVCLYALPTGKERLRYAAWLGAALAICYLIAGILFVRPDSMGDVRTWLLGSAALTLDKSFQWHGGYSLGHLRDWLRISLTMFGAGAWAGAVFLGLAAWGAFRSWTARPKVARVAALWLAGYALLFLSWEPYTEVYRITDLIPLWLLIAAGVPRPKKWMGGSAALAAGVLALGLWNLRDVIVPRSDPARNSGLQRALWIARKTPEEAWVAVDHEDQVYVPYFAHRRPLILRYHVADRDSLSRRIEAIGAAGLPLYVVP
ncbi:MAG: hypothetical protein HY551_05625, partial [Elusimicrobia bacterium]|nr:hypothetical protein [Elusimicrobiota bacterium]